MSTNMYLSALTGNQMTYGFEITFGGEPMDITGLDVEFYLKEDSGDLDSSGVMYNIGNGITVNNAVLGKVTVVVQAADIGTAEAAMWWHLDVVDPLDATNRQTALDGIFGVNTN